MTGCVEAERTPPLFVLFVMQSASVDHVIAVLRHSSTTLLFPYPTIMTPLVQHSSPLGASGISSMTFGSREKINHEALNTP